MGGQIEKRQISFAQTVNARGFSLRCDFSKKDHDALKEQNYGIWHRRIYFALAFGSAHSDSVYNFSLTRLFLKIVGAPRPGVDAFD
jgi:hypothetical protein